MYTLAVQPREVRGKLKAFRGSGQLPAVFYGRVEPSTAIGVSSADFLKIWKEAGESLVITLDTGERKIPVLIHDIDRDPVTEEMRHVDFYVIEKGKKVRIETPLVFTGTAPAVKDLGGTLVKVIHELEVEADPMALPHEISVPVDTLINFESRILIKDIKLPSGVVALQDPEEVVALVTEYREEKEEAEPVDISSIEVEKRGKEESAPEAQSEGDSK